MRALRAFRALTRIEYRELRRHPWRSGLLVGLVAIPVAALVGAATFVRITEPTRDERSVAAMGQADLRVDGLDRYEDREAVMHMLPEGARCTRLFRGAESVATPGRRLRGAVYALDADALATSGGLAHGLLRVREGRAPANAGEVALSPVLLEGLGRSPGDTVTLAYGRERTITGVVVDPEDLDAAIVLRTPAHVEGRGRHAMLVGLPSSADTGTSTEAVAVALRAGGHAVETRAEAGIGDPALLAIVLALSVIGFCEAALVIASAFAVSLRRRQYEIGLLGATGATPAAIGASQLASAAFVATLGGACGAVVGLAGVTVLHARFDEWNGRLNGGFEFAPGLVVTAVVFGIAASVLAAALPVRRATRLPIRVALGGRRPVRTRSVAGLVAGIVMLAAGLGLVLFAPREHDLTATLGVVVGPILGLVGFGTCSPWLLGALARCAGRLPVAWRLAARDAGRFRGRNGPVVTAVLAGMAMSVTTAVLVAGIDEAIAAFPPQYANDQLLVEGPGAADVARRLSRELPVVAVAPLTAVYVRGEPVRAGLVPAASGRRDEWIACGGADLVRTLGAEAGLDAFRSGRLLALYDDALPEGVELSAWLDARPLAGPPAAMIRYSRPVRGPRFVLDETRLEAFGMESGPPLNRSLVPWLVRVDGPVTRQTLARARTIAAESVHTSVDAQLLRKRPARAVYSIVFALCLLTGFIVVIVATALSAAESAGDDRILDAVGAAPSLLRARLAARAAYLALLGCVLAIPAGVLPALALSETVNFPLPFVLPWRELIATACGLPLLVYAGTWAFATVRGSRRERIWELS